MRPRIRQLEAVLSAHDIAQPSPPDMTAYRIVRRHAVTYPEYIEGPEPGEEEEVEADGDEEEEQVKVCVG